jgi:hypothetical protein
MRTRTRMQPWVPHELRKQTKAYCVTHGVSESALTAAALVQYMNGNRVDEELVVRRLDGLTQAVAQIKHDLDVLSVAFSGYAWRSFVSAETPTREGQQRATSTYWEFLRQAYEQISRGVRFPRQVLQAGSSAPSEPDGGKDGDGRKGGGGK